MKNIKEGFPKIGKDFGFYWIYYGPDTDECKPMICLMYKSEGDVYIQMFGDSTAYKFYEHPVIKTIIKKFKFNIYLSDEILY